MMEQPSFKTDENLPQEIAGLLRLSGYNALSVYDQRLSGVPDNRIMQVCKQEGRVLVTMDTDFANILAYPPENTPGIIVLRYMRQDKEHLLKQFNILLKQLVVHKIAGRLWIVSESKLRIRQ